MHTQQKIDYTKKIPFLCSQLLTRTNSDQVIYDMTSKDQKTLTFTEAKEKIWSSPELIKVVRKLRASFSDIPRGLQGRVSISEMSDLASKKLGIRICPSSLARLVENGTVLTYGLIFDNILGGNEKRDSKVNRTEGKIEARGCERIVSKKTRRESLVERVSKTTKLILD